MRIVEATNGKEALAALDRETFDMVLLDVHMPVMDGTETIRHIRASDAAWSNVPVIALTADAMTGDKERYLAHGHGRLHVQADRRARPDHRDQPRAQFQAGTSWRANAATSSP